MKRFLKLFFRFLTVASVIILWYVVLDPFMVIWKYDNYYREGHFKNCPNEAFRGMRQIEKQNYDYNAFIIGSSRSFFYYAEDWEKYIGKNNIIHFGQSGSNLWGAYQRISWLSKNVSNIDYLLLIIDPDYLGFVTPIKGYLFVEPYQVTERLDFFSFHYDFFKTFFTVECQSKFFSSFFNGGLVNNNDLAYDYNPQSNEIHKYGADKLISIDPEKYYGFPVEGGCFYQRSAIQEVLPALIEEEQRSCLEGIHEILTAKQTNYKIIVSPLYDQKKLNPEDLEYLNCLFGDGNVFDFSGINEMTSNTLNYYETSHYRPCLCAEILKMVYSGKVIENN